MNELRRRTFAAALLLSLSSLSWGEVGSIASPWVRRPFVSIPLELVEHIPAIRVSVNGQKNELFLIDSGFERTTINSEDIERLKLKTMPRINLIAKGAGSVSARGLFVGKMKLKVGGFVLRGDVPAISLADMGAKLGIHISGILGYDALRAYPSEIDYVHRRFSMYPAKALSGNMSPEYVAFATSKQDATPTIEAELGVADVDCGKAHIVLDTGAGGKSSLQITNLFGKKNSIDKLDGWSKSAATGLGGEYPYWYGQTGWIMMGHKTPVENVSFSRATEGTLAGKALDASIGGMLLQDYDLIFDVQNGRIYLFRQAFH